MSTAKPEDKKITTHTLQEMKKRSEKISMLTAYDFSIARILDDAGIDVLLVGDSASNVMAGHGLVRLFQQYECRQPGPHAPGLDNRHWRYGAGYQTIPG